MRLLALVMLLGCSKSGGPSCAEQALELDRFLMGVDRQQSSFGFTTAHLVTRDDIAPRKAAYGPSVVIEAHRFSVDGRTISIGELAETLAARHAYAADEAERRGRSTGDAHLLYLVVDEAAPWDAIVAVTEAAAQAGFTTAAFVFARTVTVKPPPRSAIDDELDRAEKGDPSEKATQLAKLLQDVVKPCPAMIEAFGRMASTEADDKATYLIQQIQPALVDCECKVDIPSLRSTMWRMLANTKPTADLALALDRKGPTIAIPAKTPWRDAHKQLKPGAAAGWLVVSP